MVEFGPEANGAWFPWVPFGMAERKNGNEGILVFRMARSVFGMRIAISSLYSRAEGAVNVTWVFHLASAPWIKSGTPARYYYPGDDWVDWIGISVYGRLRSGEAKPLVPY